MPHKHGTVALVYLAEEVPARASSSNDSDATRLRGSKERDAQTPKNQLEPTFNRTNSDADCLHCRV